MSIKKSKENKNPFKERLTLIEERVRAMHPGIDMTDAQIARFLHVNPVKWSQWKTGYVQNPASQYLKTIADLTGLTAHWLATGEGPMEDPAQAVEPQPDYGASADDLLGKTWVVLKSRTQFASALASNIHAFYDAVTQEKKIADMQEQLNTTNDTVNELKMLVMGSDQHCQGKGGSGREGM